MKRALLVIVCIFIFASWIGAQVIADFEGSVAPYSIANWGGTALTSFTKVADPTGGNHGSVGQISLTFGASASDKGGIVYDQLDPSDANFVTYWVYLPSDIPDGVIIGIVGQDRTNWQWLEAQTDVKDIPKEVWFPLSFDFKSNNLKNNLFVLTGKVVSGIQIQNYSQSPVVAWSGNILVDDVSLLSTEVGVKWIVNDFEGTKFDGFQVPSWAPSLTNLQLATSPSGSGQVLQGTLDFSFGEKADLQRTGIKLVNSTMIGGVNVTDTLKEIDMDVYIPGDIPAGVSVNFVYQINNGSWPWVSKDYIISDSSGLAPGKWTTMRWVLADYATGDLAGLDWTSAGDVHVQFYVSPAPAYTGNVYFDNLTLVGVHTPVGAVLPVELSSAVADTTILGTGKVVDYIRLDWIDNTYASATYNLYVSDKAITNATPSAAEGVSLFAPGIPGGLQRYALRPYSSDGSTATYYFAVTSVDPRSGLETVTEGKSRKGPVEIKTTPTFKIQYVSDFANSFVLDGLDDEFVPYKGNQIKAEAVNGRTAGWTDESTDISFKTTLVIDDKYLYISADVTDDDVNIDSTMQAWQGDAIEFFMGFYDESKIKVWHGKNFQHANGDWRFAFTSLGQQALDGGAGSANAIPGCEATSYTKFTGDGYICEARIALDSLAANHSFGQVYNGLVMPFRIDCNDHDATKGDAGRGAQCGVGGCPTGSAAIDLDQDWLRPHGWGWAEIVGAPTAVEQTDLLPKVFKLYNNYPNPFNPTTTIRYDLAKETQVTLKVYDITGQEVMTLVNQKQKAGTYNLQFNGSALASGIYMYRIITSEYVKTNKMILIK
jgi:hypothetical protein